MLRCENVSVEYALPSGARLTPVSGFSLALESGTMALMGPSGSGKTSLLRVMAGLQPASTGVVEIDGTAVSCRVGDPELDRRVAMIQQDYGLVSFLDVEQNIQLPRRLRRMAPATSRQVREALAMVDLAGIEGRSPSSLSGGQQQRVAIARSVVTGSRVILADEPTGSLDAENSAIVADCLLEASRTTGVLVVAATHDLAVAQRLGRVENLTVLAQVP